MATHSRAATQVASLPIARDVRWLNEQIARGARVGIFAEWISLSPELARHIIANHMPVGTNRRLRPAHVAKLAAMMAAGQWVGASHQGIAFTVTGFVNDGQHRITACAQSGVTIQIMATFGQPRDAFVAIDIDQAAREASTLLDIAGLKVGTPTTGAAIARAILALPAGMNYVAMKQVQKQQILAFVRENESAVHQASKDGHRAAGGMKARVSPANIGAATFMIRAGGADGRLVEAFLDGLSSGANLDRTSPILVCREGLREGAFGGDLRNNTDRRSHEIAAIVLAWNLYRTGKPVRSKKALVRGASFPSVVK